jgi:hypothetical protein
MQTLKELLYPKKENTMFQDLKKVVLIPMLAWAFPIALIVGGIYWSSSHSCNLYGKATGLETQHIGLETCMINDERLGWLSYEERKASRIAANTDK